ncbi:MAG: hypothetical protein IJ673_09635 [Treponema sp.]|nr:hypothetical protein [Treponema sp.]
MIVIAFLQKRADFFFVVKIAEKTVITSQIVIRIFFKEFSKFPRDKFGRFKSFFFHKIVNRIQIVFSVFNVPADFVEDDFFENEFFLRQDAHKTESLLLAPIGAVHFFKKMQNFFEDRFFVVIVFHYRVHILSPQPFALRVVGLAVQNVVHDD